MKTEFIPSEWTNKNVAMHCKTKQEAIQFCNVLHNAGMTWNTSETYLNNTKWEMY